MKKQNPWPDLPFKRALCGAPTPPVEPSRTSRAKAEPEQEECIECDNTGHSNACDARQPAYDIGDLVCRTPCNGCCPRGCTPKGLQAETDEAAARARGLLGR